MTAPTTETATTPLSLAASGRAVQLGVRAQLMQDAVKIWPLLDPKRLDETFPGWLQAMRLLVDNYHGQSATAAARVYRSMRDHAIQASTPSNLIKLAPKPNDQWLARAFGFSGPGMIQNDTARPGTALSTTLGTASRIALDGGRTTIIDTVHHDPVAVGWYRVTDGHPCAFCALLASRGIAYKTQKRASFQAHNDCGCTGAPAFSADQELPEISQTAMDVYRNRGKGPALAAFRKAWDEHQTAQSA